MSENEDVLLEFFVSLPQLKQVASDKEELVNSIVDMASKFVSCFKGQSLRECFIQVELYKDLYICFVICREKPSDGATARKKKTRNAL